MSTLDSNHIQSLAAELRKTLSSESQVYLPNTFGFNESYFRFTDYGRPTYIAAVHPATYQDVAKSIRFAHAHEIPCTAKGGGHCVSNSMQTLQNGIVIDLQKLKAISYDAGREEVTAGGGVLSGEFQEFVHSVKRETNVGSCPTTGLMGVAIGGGIGRLQGKYGYLSDNMVSCKIALADGSIVTASNKENADLFWGIRGAGHNFGIVVEATFKVYPQQHGGIHHNWDFEYRVNQARDVFRVLNEWAGKVVPNLAIFVLWKSNAASGAKNVILVNAVWSGPLEKAEPYIKELQTLDPIAPATFQTVEWPQVAWVALQGINKTYLGTRETWKSWPYKIFAAASARKFNLDTMCDLFQDLEKLEARDGVRPFAMFEVFSHERSQEFHEESTAFPWRRGSDIFLMLQICIQDFKHEDFSLEWLNRWKGRIVATSGYPRLQQYSNYGHGTNKKDPVGALYGYDEWRLQKLRGLKATYDERNWFRWYQPIIDPREGHDYGGTERSKPSL